MHNLNSIAKILTIIKIIAIIAILVFCIAGLTAVTEKSNNGYDNAQLQYFIQVNDSMTNVEKHQLIQEICDTSYPTEFQHPLYVMPSCKKSTWICKCEQRLIKSSLIL